MLVSEVGHVKVGSQRRLSAGAPTTELRGLRLATDYHWCAQALSQDLTEPPVRAVV